MKRSLCSVILLSSFSTPLVASAQIASQSEQTRSAPSESGAGQQAAVPTRVQYKIDATNFPGVKDLLDQSKLAEAIFLLESQQGAQENNPIYFNLLGVLYSQQKQFTRAAAAFERVVLIRSDDAGAWLDLAIAHAEAGDFTQADQFFDYIIENYKPNRQIVQVIEHYRSLIQRKLDDNKPWSSQFEFVVGHDSNANSGLLANRITVTFDGKDIELPLDAYQAQADSYHQISNRTHFQSQLLGQNFSFDASLSNRSFTKAHTYSYTDASLGMSLSHSFPMLDIGVAGAVEHFIWGNHSLLNNSETSVFIEKNFGACHLSYVLDYESRRYVSATHLNARSIWRNLAGSCQGSFSSQYHWEAALIARRADDKPVVFRAGGVTSRQENILRLSIKTPIKLRADLSFSFGRAADSEGYSALLDNNAKRVVQRHNYRLQLTYPLAKDFTALLAYEDNRNDSNLVLFRQRGRNISAGLRLNY